MSKQRLGRILMAPELLVGILDYDKQHKVRDVYMDGKDDGRVITIVVEGPSMPEITEDQQAAVVTPVYRRKDYERIAP